MTNKSLMAAFAAALSLVVAVAAQTPAPQPRQAAPAPAAGTPAAPTGTRPTTAAVQTPAPTTNQVGNTATEERALLNQYCVACHNEKAKATMDSARKLTLDNIDPADVMKDADKWELVVRKLRAGMMPPPGMKRPDPPVYEAMIAFLENELDRNSTPYMPPPGLHRLNRTEYANVVRDVLELEIDPAKYLPNDDSTHGFDNIAGALGLSSTLVEAYVSAAQKISRLAIGEVEPPSLVVYQNP